MQKIDASRAHPLHDTAATRALEAGLTAALPPHTLMQRAGLATARLALALAPHAQRFWIACGPGNNGGDGLEAAIHLHQWGKQVHVSWLGTPDQAPADARQAHARAQAAGVPFVNDPPTHYDVGVDALLGLGPTRTPTGHLADWISHINAHDALVLAVDLPSGLHADTGTTPGIAVQAHHTLSLLTLKPGLFTGHGRDAAGQVWFDPLHAAADAPAADHWLLGPPAPRPRRHATHKGSYGDVVVIGGSPGMTGAALLAATAALHHGAGRIYVSLLDAENPTDNPGIRFDPAQPELMFRPAGQLDLSQRTIVCGCGGGDVVRAHLPRVLSSAPRLVLDADALNAIVADTSLRQLLRTRAHRGWQTALTPHPLEAARLLGNTTPDVQANRLQAARTLAQDFQCTVVLKGSGTVVAAPGHTTAINPTGNARLATAGTGDVLAGMLGAQLATGLPAFEAACTAVYLHGLAADRWPAGRPCTAGALARQ